MTDSATADLPVSGLELRSLLTEASELELTLEPQPVTPPGPGEVVVRVEASPVNPSDLGLLLGAADLATARTEGEGAARHTSISVPPKGFHAMASRLGQSMTVGNEGSGVVISAGDDAASLLGKTVAVLAGGMYSQYRTVPAGNCLVLPDDVTPAEGASCFVNPLTALGMVETMRDEGHTALVHTAAASNLGQMLNKICAQDNVGLVNIVRSAAQEELLRGIGARYVCNSTADDFVPTLVEAVAETGATLAFDAIGGGRLASTILSAMETAAGRRMTSYSRYGSSVLKQVYIYGSLDTGPTELDRSFGMSWSVGGWLLTPFLQKIGPSRIAELHARVAAGVKTTFASHYTQTIPLADLLKPQILQMISRKATGEKFLVTPAQT
ncbi:zinc-binding dehydrogenase [Mycobacterium aquaticum]|uniref:NADH oxidase n=1 Tax=Mycobacterium aquaticum TaxID=1927124 RepID=A0A1X0B901_9MYCO|nr:zinc-binding dehydrogenase [Mycobacterium aquaticum]ORA38822.1 NADH oxidase [Mycobacterium aquaticum]